MTIPFAILSWAKSALSGLLDLFKRYPWQMACIVLLAASLWLYSGKADYREKYANEQQGRKADRAEWDRKVALAQAAADKARKDAQEIAGEADKTHDALLADNAGLERYIADHRVQPKACAAASGGSGGGPIAGVPPEPAAVPVVAISEPDIRSCDSAYVYALSAYQWGQDLMAKGLAEK